jgi:hypothetical protein
MKEHTSLVSSYHPGNTGLIPGSYLLRTRQKSAFGPIPVRYQNRDKHESVNIDPIPVLNWSVKRDIQPVSYVRLETMHWCVELGYINFLVEALSQCVSDNFCICDAYDGWACSIEMCASRWKALDLVHEVFRLKQATSLSDELTSSYFSLSFRFCATCTWVCVLALSVTFTWIDKFSPFLKILGTVWGHWWTST